MEKQISKKAEIIDFSDEYSDAIKILNYEWLEKYFHITEADKISLSNPREEIIEKGGFIFYAKLGDDIVGTASLLKENSSTFTFSKMAVSDKAQGYGIGTLLLEHCIEAAKSKDITTIVLYTNSQLLPALHLYKKYGFEEVELEKGYVARANIKMVKHL